MNSITEISNATYARTEILRLSFLWHWGFCFGKILCLSVCTVGIKKTWIFSLIGKNIWFPESRFEVPVSADHICKARVNYIVEIFLQTKVESVFASQGKAICLNLTRFLTSVCVLWVDHLVKAGIRFHLIVNNYSARFYIGAFASRLFWLLVLFQ